MLENIKLNNIEDIIVPINASMANKHDKMCIAKVDVERTGSTYHRSECNGEISALSLGELTQIWH
jgi:hypothetical protein